MQLVKPATEQSELCLLLVWRLSGTEQLQQLGSLEWEEPPRPQHLHQHVGPQLGRPQLGQLPRQLLQLQLGCGVAQLVPHPPRHLEVFLRAAGGGQGVEGDVEEQQLPVRLEEGGVGGHQISPPRDPVI